ncbi:uncharacterized protein [Centruroides vittatus]|uniref:uncharacterized protein n=1 Tax=Centruroides vittatus TaxID=120091 RepID=UPI0035101FE3
MAILKCCCWKSVRRGSFVSGIYTLMFYITVLTAGAFQIKDVEQSLALFILTTLMLIFSALCVLTSVLLLIGLCVDNRLMLLPWIVAVTMTTLLDIILAFYLINDTNLDIIKIILFVIDFVMCGLHIYCLLCVISQYQDYLIGRGRAGADNGNQAVPPVRFLSNIPSQHNAPQAISKSQNGAPSTSLSTSTTTSSSTTTTKSFHPTDLSSITEEPSSYEPSDVIINEDDASIPHQNPPKKINQMSTEKERDSSTKSTNRGENEEMHPRRLSATHLLETEIAHNNSEMAHMI